MQVITGRSKQKGRRIIYDIFFISMGRIKENLFRGELKGGVGGDFVFAM